MNANRLAFAAAAWLLAAGGAAWGQISELRSINPLSPNTKGLQLYGVTAFSSYFSSAVPLSVGTNGFFPYANQFSSDVVSGGSARFGWSAGKKSSFAVAYGISYVSNVNHPEWNNLNHNFSFTVGRPRQVGKKLTLRFGGGANIITFQNFLFAPNQFSTISTIPATPEEYTSALLNRGYSNDQLAAALTGSPMPDSALQNLLYGNKVLSASGQFGLSYAYTKRLSFDFSVGETHQQPLKFSDSNKQSSGVRSTDYNVPVYASALGHTDTVTAAASVSYMLSPHTSAGVTLTGSRGLSRFQDAYTASASVFVTQTLGRHWFFNGHVGSGDLITRRTTFAVKTTPQLLAGGSIGFKYRHHTLAAATDRTIGDSYALGASSTVTSTGAWFWESPGRAWGIYVNVGQQQLRSSELSTINSWRGGAGITRSLGSSASLDLGYGYFANRGQFGGLPYSFKSSGVQLAVTWVPPGIVKANRAAISERRIQ